EDLFYRLNVVPIHLPPLRERKGDIPSLVEHFVSRFNERLKKNITGVDEEALARLMAHPWPGNIRELENVLERTILFCEGPRIHAADLPPETSGNAAVAAPPAAAAVTHPQSPPGSTPAGGTVMPPLVGPDGQPRASSLKELV